MQQQPLGLCDALFHAESFTREHEQVLIGLPDTIWFPENAYRSAVDRQLAEVNLVLFPVDRPSVFDAVVCDPQNFVERVEVKVESPSSPWVWGAITSTAEAFHALKLLWESRHRQDVYLGTLLNAYIEAGNSVFGQHIGEIYIDVGTLEGYRRAQDFLRHELRPVALQSPAA